MLPTQAFGFLVILAVFTAGLCSSIREVIFAAIGAGLSSAIPKEFKDAECRSCFNQSDPTVSKNGELHTRTRRYAEVKRVLQSRMYAEDCARIGTIGVGDTYTMDVRNSEAADNVAIPLTPARATNLKGYSLTIMCPEDARIEVEHTFMDRKFEKDSFVWDCSKEDSRVYRAPSLSRHTFSIKNVAGTKNKKKIMFKLQAGGEQCSQITLWQKEQHKRQKDPFSELLKKYVDNVDLYDALSKITSVLSNLVPVPGLSSVVDLIWSYVKPSEWDKRIKEVSARIKNETIKQNLISSRHHLNEVQVSIENLEKIRKTKPSSLHYYIHFAQVSENLLTEQVYFQFEDLESNLATLPLLTVTMSLIVQFYSAILNDPEYTLNDEQMNTVRTTRTTVLEHVNKHILSLYEDHMISAFNNCDEANMFGRTQMYIYDCVVDAHNLVAMQGLKFLSTWNKLANFDSKDTRTIHIPIYSHYIGRPTDYLIADLYLSNKISLLTPPVYDLNGCFGNSPNPTCFYRKRVTAINIIVADHLANYQISTILFTLDNEPEFDKRSGKTRHFSRYDYRTHDIAEGVYIKKIRAGINERLRYIEFYLTDGSMISHGLGFTDKTIPETIFELPGHHIADILVKSDDEKTGLYGWVAYGVGVSYLPNPTKN